jgi:hypothetical protein
VVPPLLCVEFGWFARLTHLCSLLGSLSGLAGVTRSFPRPWGVLLLVFLLSFSRCPSLCPATFSDRVSLSWTGWFRFFLSWRLWGPSRVVVARGLRGCRLRPVWCAAWCGGFSGARCGEPNLRSGGATGSGCFDSSLVTLFSPVASLILLGPWFPLTSWWRRGVLGLLVASAFVQDCWPSLYSLLLGCFSLFRTAFGPLAVPVRRALVVFPPLVGLYFGFSHFNLGEVFTI